MEYTFKQFQAEYPDDGACLDKIMAEQYGGKDLECPACKVKSRFHRIAKRRAYACQNCGHHIYPCVGTIFEKSRTPLTNWFFAMYLMTSTRHGVAAKELERQIGCTYKTAWRMAHELRKLMAVADDNQILDGHIELDETVIGGHQSREEEKADGSNKAIVFGMLDRDRDIVRALPVIDARKNTLVPLVIQNVKPGSTVSTDEYKPYKSLKGLAYKHGAVNHQKKQYVKGIHHVNSLEGHWSQLKRSISGTHVQVSAKHLWKYVAEFSYRRNFRVSHFDMFNRLISAFSLPTLRDA